MSATTISPRLFDSDAAPTVRAAPLAWQHVVHPAPAADAYLHPAVVGIALIGPGLFAAASWVGWAVGYTALLVAVVHMLGVMYFWPMLHLGRTSAQFRGEVTRRSFTEFLAGHVQTFTGRVSGAAALMQIAFLPIVLGCLMCFFAAAWLGVRG